jgi:hypothetical protein
MLPDIVSVFATGEKRRKLEEEKGIIIRFVIGHRLVQENMYFGRSVWTIVKGEFLLY